MRGHTAPAPTPIRVAAFESSHRLSPRDTCERRCEAKQQPELLLVLRGEEDGGGKHPAQSDEHASADQLEIRLARMRERAEGAPSEREAGADEREEESQPDGPELRQQLEIRVVDDVRLVEHEVDRGEIGRPARVGALDRLEIADADADDRMVV